MSNKRVVIAEFNEAGGYNEHNYAYSPTFKRLFSQRLVIVDSSAEMAAGKTRLTLNVDRDQFAKLVEAGLIIKPLADAFKAADARLSAYDECRSGFIARGVDALVHRDELFSDEPLATACEDVVDMPRVQVIVERYGLARKPQ